MDGALRKRSILPRRFERSSLVSRRLLRQPMSLSRCCSKPSSPSTLVGPSRTATSCPWVSRVPRRSLTSGRTCLQMTTLRSRDFFLRPRKPPTTRPMTMRACCRGKSLLPLYRSLRDLLEVSRARRPRFWLLSVVTRVSSAAVIILGRHLSASTGGYVVRSGAWRTSSRWRTPTSSSKRPTTGTGCS